MRPKMISGFQATGKLTLGNYLGVIKPAVELQEKFDLYVFVADLHALTGVIEPEKLRESKQQIRRAFVQAGLDESKCKLFDQSDLSQHTYLGWILTTQTTIGELKRMTQFKDKASRSMANKSEMIPTGLLVYPALMAADILLYQSEYVLVGSDQTQHLELTRNIATRFNNKYGETFVVPKPYIIKETQKIMSLQEPLKKMSKSDKKIESTIFLDDDPQRAYKKIMNALTDSEGRVYFSPEKPGISNLMNIYGGLTNKTIPEIEEEFRDKNYAQFKQAVGNQIKEFLENFQQQRVESSSESYQNLLVTLNREAQETLEKVKTNIGLS